MASVYLARVDGVARFQRLFAIKRLHPHLARDASFVDMFLDEARLAARIRHPNVVPILEVGSSAQGYYLVMEYIEGDTAARFMAKAADSGERLPVASAIRIAVDSLAGLHAAHELADAEGPLKIVHRDVSPQNILVGIDGSARITDFGVAHAAARLSTTRTGQIKGKLAYMSPEQARAAPVDRRADVWALGVVLWEMLAATRLFKGATDAETMHRILYEPVPTLRASGVNLPESLEAVCMRALEPDVLRRYATAAEFADALEQVARPLGLLASARDLAAYVDRAIGPEMSQQRELLNNWLSPSESSPSEAAKEDSSRRQSSSPRVGERTPTLPSAEGSSRPKRESSDIVSRRAKTGTEDSPSPRTTRSNEERRSPSSTVDKAEPTRVATKSTPPAPQRLLTIDDSQTVRNLVRVYLMGMNFEFFESARADLGLTILETGAIDLVIADINMPGMDGLAFLREVRASTNAGMRRVPVVLLTSDKSPETRARAISSGASGFVLKPVTSSNLRETVTSLLKANARLG